jgi:hypothetical protein
MISTEDMSVQAVCHPQPTHRSRRATREYIGQRALAHGATEDYVDRPNELLGLSSECHPVAQGWQAAKPDRDVEVGQDTDVSGGMWR